MRASPQRKEEKGGGKKKKLRFDKIGWWKKVNSRDNLGGALAGKKKDNQGLVEKGGRRGGVRSPSPILAKLKPKTKKKYYTSSHGWFESFGNSP